MAKQQGDKAGAEKHEPVAKADAVPHPQAAGEGGKHPAQGLPDPKPQGVGSAEAKSVDHGTLGIHTTDGIKTVQTIGEKPAGAAKAGDAVDPPVKPVLFKGRAAVIWAQPGHELLGVGQMISVPPDYAQMLRSVGRVRFASEAEVKNAEVTNYQIREFESV